ncbi:MAG: hypothetical protein ACF8R9_00190 [Phycisphaerales bacterium JB054]
MPEDHQHNPDLPIEIETLTALIEGDLSGPEAHEVRERLLDADAELAQRVELMSQDRVVLRTLGDELPPEGLDEAILEQLERAALLGLQNGEPGTASLPVSRVGRLPQHRRRRMPWLHRPAGAGLAAAALLVLSVGVVMQLLPSGPRPAPVGPLASGELAHDAAASDLSATEPSQTAIAGDVPTPPPETTLATEVAAAKQDPAHPGAAAVTGEIFTGDWDRALALLDEGRLLIRVRSASPEATLTRLEPLSARTARAGEAWRLEHDVTEPLAVAMHQKFAIPLPDPADQFIAAENGVRRPLVVPSLTEGRSALEGIYLVDARRDTAAIASLNAALSLGDGQVAVFEALAEPLELPGVLTPDAVLWWSRPASSWSERRYVPVVIERVDR